MDNAVLTNDLLKKYENKLLEVNLALQQVNDGVKRDKLISLKNDLHQLIDLVKTDCDKIGKNSSNNGEDTVDEYALFLSEMQKEGAIEPHKEDLFDTIDWGSLEGSKCKAPHKHNWGNVTSHNAMICSIVNPECRDKNELKVKVFYLYPTHIEMLPCQYYLNTSCKFDEKACRYSHGEIVSYTDLQTFTEPNFELVTIGSKVLAKKLDNLWYRATVKHVHEGKCTIKFDLNSKDMELELADVLPLEENNTNIEEDEITVSHDDTINESIMVEPLDEALGSWEKYTKGIGSKLMAKMGYTIGSGLGKNSDGRLEPVSACVLPVGKSLDYCMQLRENSLDDNLFNAEKRLKKFHKHQEKLNKKNYNRAQKSCNVFTFINQSLASGNNKEISLAAEKSKHRKEMKEKSDRNLNVYSLEIAEKIKKLEREVDDIKESLIRNKDVNSNIYKKLIVKLQATQQKILALQGQAVNIHVERSLRKDKQKMTVF